jgi:hypothetical protein
MVIDRKNKPSEIRALLRELIEDVPCHARRPSLRASARLVPDLTGREGGQSCCEIGKVGTHPPHPITSIKAGTAAVARLDKRGSTRKGPRPSSACIGLPGLPPEAKFRFHLSHVSSAMLPKRDSCESALC